MPVDARDAADPTAPLPAALPGERLEVHGRAGRLACYVTGDGPPLLLMHSINAAASAYEVRPICLALQATRRIYAPDLPGFGASDRGARCYDIKLYTDAVHDILDLIGREAGPAPVDALAISLSSEFLVRAAVERPERLRSLTLVTPTGFRRGASRLRGAAGASREIPLMHGLLSLPGIGRCLFALLTTRPSIRYFLARTWGSKAIDEGLAEYDWLSARRPGAERAPFAFLSGRLFAADIRTLYEQLTLPVWVPHGTRGDFADFSEAAWAKARPSWSFQPFATGALPHFEQPEAFLAAFCRFLRDGAAAQPSASAPRSPSP